MIDLRSDTVTRPTAGMLKAMTEASVGDDVYGEDPSVNRLEAYTAEITGMEASLFMPSGCMANLTALYLLCGRGNEVLTHRTSHIMQYEMASPAAIAGVMIVPVPGERGLVSPEELPKWFKQPGGFSSHPTLVNIENSANQAGGACYREDQLKALREVTRRAGILIHMDGARAFNASIASDLPIKRMCSYADSLTLCLSKGLGAPAGSMLCGRKEYIAEARRVRKLLGGGMRQVGFYAAAGIYALEHHIDRLEEDHIHAQIIAEAAASSSWAEIQPEEVETNIVIASTRSSAGEIVHALHSQGVLAGAVGDNRIRFVTHLDVDRPMIEQAARIIAGI